MDKPKMVICFGSSCYARGNAKNLEVVESFMKEYDLEDEVDIDLSAGLCTENCTEGPIVILNDHIYKHVSSGTMRDILQSVFSKKKTINN